MLRRATADRIFVPSAGVPPQTSGAAVLPPRWHVSMSAVHVCGLRFRLPAVGDAPPHLHRAQATERQQDAHTPHDVRERGHQGCQLRAFASDAAATVWLLTPALPPTMSSRTDCGHMEYNRRRRATVAKAARRSRRPGERRSSQQDHTSCAGANSRQAVTGLAHAQAPKRRQRHAHVAEKMQKQQHCSKLMHCARPAAAALHSARNQLCGP